MKIVVRAKPGAKYDKVEKINDNEFSVSVIAPPIGGKANAAIIELLADYFGTKKPMVEIISGHWSKIKVVEIHGA